jgi:hypothetical protein
MSHSQMLGYVHELIREYYGVFENLFLFRRAKQAQ